MKPIIITTFSKIVVAEALAEAQGIAERLEMFDVEQFLAGNIMSRKFAVTGRKATADACGRLQ